MRVEKEFVLTLSEREVRALIAVLSLSSPRTGDYLPGMDWQFVGELERELRGKANEEG